MKRPLHWALIALLGLSLAGCVNGFGLAGFSQSPRTDEAEQAAVKKLVEDFGGRLQSVSLLSPKEDASRSIEDNYGNLVSPALLRGWQADPANAPGRRVSSPWPDRIEIVGLEKSSRDEYRVTGEIIEVTSAEQASGGTAAKQSIVLVVRRSKDRWLINAVTLGEYAEVTSIVHRDAKYGFSFALPKSWAGYSIVTEEWEGNALAGQGQGTQANGTAEAGPLIIIRHPRWTEESKRQDIPVMVFTRSQWDALQEGRFHIGAAPIGPSLLGRNDDYVFALPARYNYAFPPGFEEVEEILKGNPLQVAEVATSGSGETK